MYAQAVGQIVNLGTGQRQLLDQQAAHPP